MNDQIIVEKSSGNVFADLGLPNPEEALLKAQLVMHLAEIIARRGLTQAGAARLLNIDQPKVSALLRGRLRGFSTDRLLRFVTALGYDVTLEIREKPDDRAEARLKVASANSAAVGARATSLSVATPRSRRPPASRRR
jgi:predicted XRE-type DNA-binding protein